MILTSTESQGTSFSLIEPATSWVAWIGKKVEHFLDIK